MVRVKEKLSVNRCEVEVREEQTSANTARTVLQNDGERERDKGGGYKSKKSRRQQGISISLNDYYGLADVYMQI